MDDLGAQSTFMGSRRTQRRLEGEERKVSTTNRDAGLLTKLGGAWRCNVRLKSDLYFCFVPVSWDRFRLSRVNRS